MRSPLKSVLKRERDAVAAMNLPPGFRFHPTDEELVVHYLCRKAATNHHHATAGGVTPFPPIIAEVDLYKHDPWDLPAMALLGTKEWYFFTPRDRKYPNGSRPNRAAGNGYWKATGADKPISPKTTPNTTVGIKKALVFYAGKGSKGIKTNWIMHEYRLAKPDYTTTNATTHKLDEWVLCRLYNKKDNPDEKFIPKDGNHAQSPLEELQRDNSSNNSSATMYSFNSLDHDSDAAFCSSAAVDDHSIMFLSNFPPQTLTKVNGTSNHNRNTIKKMENFFMQGDDDNYGNEWLVNLSLEDLQRYLNVKPREEPFQGIGQINRLSKNDTCPNISSMM